MLLEYWYSPSHKARARRTLKLNVFYTHCIPSHATDDDRERELPEDAWLVAEEYHECIPNEKEYLK